MTNIDRSEAVNLARNLKENDMQPPPTPKGVRLLIDAVLAMEEVLSAQYKRGDVVITRNEAGVIVAVTRQDKTKKDEFCPSLRRLK